MNKREVALTLYYDNIVDREAHELGIHFIGLKKLTRHTYMYQLFFGQCSYSY